jgi:hypothetical protein
MRPEAIGVVYDAVLKLQHDRSMMTCDDPGPVELASRLSALAEAVHAAEAVPAGRLFGLEELPDGDCWVDIAGAAALTGTAPKTITSWRTRGGPVRDPFPVPRRLLYRLYWPRQEIMRWTDRQRALAARSVK